MPWATTDVIATDRLADGTISPAGAVRFVATTHDLKITSIVITAFEIKYILDKHQISRIGDFRLDSLKITQEAGYSSLGGFTVYFCLRRHFYNDTHELQIEEARISIPKAGDMKVTFSLIDIKEKAQQGDAVNPHAFGTFVTHPAAAGSAPKASGDRSSWTFDKISAISRRSGDLSPIPNPASMLFAFRKAACIRMIRCANARFETDSVFTSACSREKSLMMSGFLGRFRALLMSLSGLFSSSIKYVEPSRRGNRRATRLSFVTTDCDFIGIILVVESIRPAIPHDGR